MLGEQLQPTCCRDTFWVPNLSRRVGAVPQFALTLAASSLARGVVPTPLGPVSIDWHHKEGFCMELKLPGPMTALVYVPDVPGAEGVFVNDHPAEADLDDGYWILKKDLTGKSDIEVR